MERKAYWYSVVRYSGDSISGEIINVGIILHSSEDQALTRQFILDETSSKLKAIFNSKVDETIYKSYKDTIEFYLRKSTDHLTGQVGNIAIGSPYTEDFLYALFESYKSERMFLSEPTFALTNDPEALFLNLFTTYVGEKHIRFEEKELSVKRYVRKVFEDKDYLDKKVATDIELYPLKEVKSLKLNIDFGFKNGVWNYLQAVPLNPQPSRSAEWFAKTKLLFESVKDEAKFYLIYRSSDPENSESIDALNYLVHQDKRVNKLDLDDGKLFTQLCWTIENEAHDINELVS